MSYIPFTLLFLITYLTYLDIQVKGNSNSIFGILTLPPVPIPDLPLPPALAATPACLLHQCGAKYPLGAFTLFCPIACKAAGYDTGNCTNIGEPSPSSATCVCHGTGGKPEIFLITLPCENFCHEACLTCGYQNTYSCPFDGNSTASQISCICS